MRVGRQLTYRPIYRGSPRADLALDASGERDRGTAS